MSEAQIPGEPSRREAAKQETREALLAAAMAEFAEKGLDVPSLDAICARAGFTRGAFYVHFRDRDDLVAAVMEHVLGLFLEHVVGAGGAGRTLADAIERFVLLGVAGIEDLGRSAGAQAPLLSSAVPFHQILAAAQRSEPTRLRLAAMLEEAARRLTAIGTADRRSDALRSDVSPALVANLLLLLALGVRAAADLRLPFDVGATRDALLALLRTRQR